MEEVVVTDMRGSLRSSMSIKRDTESRQMLKSGIDNPAESSSLAFGSANLVSESISAVDIRMTSWASIPAGGIGVAVNTGTVHFSAPYVYGGISHVYPNA